MPTYQETKDMATAAMVVAHATQAGADRAVHQSSTAAHEKHVDAVVEAALTAFYNDPDAMMVTDFYTATGMHPDGSDNG